MEFFQTSGAKSRNVSKLSWQKFSHLFWQNFLSRFPVNFFGKILKKIWIFSWRFFFGNLFHLLAEISKFAPVFLAEFWNFFRLFSKIWRFFRLGKRLQRRPGSDRCLAETAPTLRSTARTALRLTAITPCLTSMSHHHLAPVIDWAR